jgi:hypothetical protein
LYAIKITRDTDKMYKILNETYYNARNKNIVISDLGHSTNDFAFFVASSATQSLTLSKSKLSDETKVDKLVKLLANRDTLPDPERLD